MQKVMEEQDIQIVKVSSETVSKEEYDALKDKYLRLYADFQNFRCAVEKDKDRVEALANFDAVYGLLPILDDIERAYELSSDPEGFSLIYNKIQTYLRELGVSDFGNEGEQFDGDKHEAAFLTYDGTVEKGCISKVIKKGYIMNDVIIRYAQVAVES